MNIYRGDIYYIDWVDYATPVGSEQRPGRPAIIVSNNEDNMRLNTVQVVYLTSQDKPPRPSHVKVICRVPSIALCEQLTTVTKERLGTYVRTCTEAEMAEIDKGIMAVLDLHFPVTATSISSSTTTETDILRLQTERDTYKALYNEMLGRLLPAK